MGFSESNLHRNEKIVLDLHPHWIVLAKGVVLLVLMIALGGWVLWGWSPEGTTGTVVPVRFRQTERYSVPATPFSMR